VTVAFPDVAFGLQRDIKLVLVIGIGNLGAVIGASANYSGRAV
jgi:hypothetical protein